MIKEFCICVTAFEGETLEPVGKMHYQDDYEKTYQPMIGYHIGPWWSDELDKITGGLKLV